MKITLNIKPLIVAIVSFVVAYMTVTYKIDEYITFAGEDNALAFFIMSSTLGMLSLFASFEKISK